MNSPQPLQQTIYDSEYLAAVSKPQLALFMKDRPDIWFYLIEAEFNASRTKSDDVNPFASKRGLFRESRLSSITDRGIIREPAAVFYYQ